MAAVKARMPDGYQPQGITLGAFQLLPSLGINGGYDSNITATNVNPKEDWLLLVRPAALLESTWMRHYLAFDSYFESGSYAKYSDADYQNYSVGARGRYDISADMELSSYVRWSHLNELPGDDEVDTGIQEPLSYDQTLAGVALYKKFNRLWARAQFDFQDRDFENYLNGAPTDQAYRTGQTYTTGGRIGYEISPLTSVFVGGSYIDYDMEDDNYDASEWKAITGLQFEPSRIMRGEAFVGYGEWTSDSGYLDNVPKFTYGGVLEWYTTPLLTTTFTASQEVLTSNYYYNGEIGSAVLSSNFGVRMDYELRRNIVLSGWFNYQNQDYYDFPRDDDTYVAGAAVKYLINRYVTAQLNYTYTDFDTNFNGINGAESFTRNVVMGGVTLKY